MIQQGAKLVQNIEDILNELPSHQAASLVSSGSAPGGQGAGPDLSDLTGDERSVLSMLDEVEPAQLDALADRASFGVARLQAALFGLEIRGAVDQTPGKYYLLRPRREV